MYSHSLNHGRGVLSECASCVGDAGASTDTTLAIIETIPDAPTREKMAEKYLLDIHMMTLVDGKERPQVSPET